MEPDALTVTAPLFRPQVAGETVCPMEMLTPFTPMLAASVSPLKPLGLHVVGGIGTLGVTNTLQFRPGHILPVILLIAKVLVQLLLIQLVLKETFTFVLGEYLNGLVAKLSGLYVITRLLHEFVIVIPVVA